VGKAALGASVGFEGSFICPNAPTPFLFGEDRAMQPLLSTLPVMSVTTIFFAWNLYRHALAEHRQRRLRERVAFMLWTAADYVH
jgi:hypothetical protein